MDVTRAIRFQGAIPIRFWGLCVLAVVYIINRMPSSILQHKSPFEKLYKRKPSIQHLRVLGCLCFAKHVQETDKMLSRTRVAVHMVYVEN